MENIELFESGDKYMPPKKTVIFRIFISLVLIFLILFSVFNVCNYVLISKSEMVENISNPMKLYGIEKCFYDENFIYITDSSRGFVQIFEPNGEFKNCVSLPTKGGSVWVGLNNNTLYCYCVRPETLFVFRNGEIIDQSNNYYINQKDFYNSNHLISDTSVALKKNVVMFGDKSVILETTSSRFSIAVYGLLFYVSFASLLFVSGLMKKVSNKIVITKNPLGIIAIFFIFFIFAGLAFFPSISSLIFFLLAVATAPFKTIQDAIWSKVPRIVHIIAIIVLFFVGLLIAPFNTTTLFSDKTKPVTQSNYLINDADDAIMIASEHIEENYPGFFEKIKDNLVVEETNGVWTVYNVWPPREENGFIIYTYGGVVEVKLDKNSGELISIVFQE